MRKNPARARSLASTSGKRLPASMRSRSARIRGRKARAASMALVAVLLVAIGPPALPHGRDRSVSHLGLGMAGLGGGIAAGSPDMLIAIRGGFFRPTNRGCRPWGNSWVQPHLRRNSLKRLTRRRKHPRRGPASRRIHELVQLGEIGRPDRDRKDLWMPLPNCSNFLNSVHAWPRTLINNARFRSLYG